MKTIKKRGTYTPLTSLHRLEFILQHKSDSLLRDSLGVGFGQVQIMQALHRSVPLTQRAVAVKLHQTEANVSRQLQLLKKKGLVNITRNKKDKRLRETSLTAKGQQTFAKAEKILSAQHKELLKMVDDRDVKALDRAVSHLLKAL
ncbi:MarR family transcriptional regulator [Candidatus Saccharibacteria bacterium]|nr:MarR family transcriptional regulator [Candidatus Saccharibacteria bacterium]